MYFVLDLKHWSKPQNLPTHHFPRMDQKTGLTLRAMLFQVSPNQASIQTTRLSTHRHQRKNPPRNCRNGERSTDSRISSTCDLDGGRRVLSHLVVFLERRGRIVGRLGRSMKLRVSQSFLFHCHLIHVGFVSSLALMEYHCSDDKSVASRIFEKGLDLFGDEVEFVLRYLGFLISVNDENSAYQILRHQHSS